MDAAETTKPPLGPSGEPMYPAVPDQQNTAYPPPYSGYPSQQPGAMVQQPAMMGQMGQQPVMAGQQPAMVGQPPMMQQQPPMMQQQPVMMQQPMQMQPMVQNSSSVNVAVTAPTVESARSYGSSAMVFGVILALIYFFCGCWHGFLCVFVAIYFALSASSAKTNDEGSKYNQWSIRCSICSIVSVFALDALIVIISVVSVVVSAGATASSVASLDS